MRILKLTIDEETAGRTVKNLLKRELQLSSSLITHLKYRPGSITCNHVPVRTTDKPSCGDILRVDISDDPSPELPATEGFPLRILYEDDDLLLLDKPAGAELHPDRDQLRNPSLKDAVLRYLGPGAVFHPVNRLDVDTSGVLTVAKHRHACELLRRQLHTEAFIREYIAVCKGVPPERESFASGPVCGLPAKTHYHVLAHSSDCSLVKLRLFTGRTHQIRIHMAELGCPLLGDERYGTADPRIRRTALHSVFVQLRHPLSGELLRFFCPPPEDFVHAADPLGQNADLLTADGFCAITDLLV